MVADQMQSRRKKILVADDDPEDRKLMSMALGNAYAVIEAKDGRQAVALAQLEKPDIIVMDLMMPIKDGLSASAEIRANQMTKAIPIIMLSGVEYELDQKLALSLGVNTYLTKPFTPQDLLDAIDSL